MAKKSLASLELAAIINELQFLKNAKISQIYHPDKKELMLQLHARGQGKQLLKIIPGKLLCLTKEKETTLRPSGFCMQLRKYLNNAVVKDIYQQGSERIVIFEIEKEENYILIIELFSKGNVVLTDEKYQIIGALEEQIWKDRSVKAKEKYVFPAAAIDWKKVSDKELAGILKKSEKRNLATSLATELGLGGLYAEEICKINDLDFTKLPADATEKEVKLLTKTIKDLLKKIETPAGYVYEQEVTPFPLTGMEPRAKTKTYNEAADTIQPLEKSSPYEKKIAALNRTLTDQQESITSLEQKIEVNKRKGELIYEQYAPLQKLREIVQELRKSKEWSEVAKELAKEKKIRDVDLKRKIVTIDL